MKGNYDRLSHILLSVVVHRHHRRFTFWNGDDAMNAILWVLILAGTAGEPGKRYPVSEYPAVADEKHLAMQLCQDHAKMLTRASENLAYYCVEGDPRK